MRIFDFICEKGHKCEEMYRSTETVPDELPCEACAKAGESAIMTRVKFYPTAGYCLPSGPGSYNQGF